MNIGAKIWEIDVLFHLLEMERISEYIQFFTKLPFACLWGEVMGLGLGCGEGWSCVEMVVWLFVRVLRWGCLLVMHWCSAVCYWGGWHRCAVVMRGDGTSALLLWEGDDTGYVTGAFFCEGPTPVTTPMLMLLIFFLLFFTFF